MKSKKITLNDKSVQYLLKCDKRLAKVITTIGDIECYMHEDSYEFIVMQIVGQMLSNKVAKVINERLVTICQGRVTLDTISNISFEELRSIGLSKAKCEYIKFFTDAVVDKTIDFCDFDNLSNEDIICALSSIKGIGHWTAKMYLIFVLQREDVLPFEDVAFLQGYRWLYKTQDISPKSVKKKCNKWKPYSSIAARYLYRAVDEELVKDEFHLYK
ncbi:MAG: hypothetical protein PUE12_12885 [Oscillospiraceae bacterium]|nr:hypothetical protein [Oscillospiraceae bacterium]